jgi:hypothetical protein
MNCKCRIKIILVILTFLFSYSNLKAEEKIGSQHSVGLGFLIAYDYSEPDFMWLRSGVISEENQLENIEFLYNYNNSFNLNGYLSEIELDSRYQFQTQSYWQNQPGTMTDIDVEIYNLRALYGIKLSNKLMLKTGVGYRYLFHHWKNRVTTTGGKGYDREQDYTYIPILAELKSEKGKLKIEFDHIIDGTNTSYLSQASASSLDTDFKNDNGFMFKTSFEIENNGITIEPYYEFLAIEESDLVGGSKEPSNITNEIGFRLIKVFNNNKTVTSNYKNIINNDQFYYGTKILISEVETGLYSPSGSGKIEEDGTGFSIISGMQLLDGIKNLPIKLNLEIAFNQFGDSRFECNSGDTVMTDGRYAKNTYSGGTTLSCNVDNLDIAIESYSTSFGIKPSFKILNNIYLDANIGYHRWDQSENTTSYGNSSTLTNYAGTDIYMGASLNYENNNLSFGIEYLEHTMEYDAKSFAGSLKYKF